MTGANRHAVVNVSAQRVRCRGDNGAVLGGLAVLDTTRIPDASKRGGIWGRSDLAIYRTSSQQY